MIVQYHPLAASDLNRAVSYYNRQRLGLGDEFRVEVYAAIERIRSNPRQFAIVERDMRRGFMHSPSSDWSAVNEGSFYLNSLSQRI